MSVIGAIRWGGDVLRQQPEWYGSAEARAVANSVIKYQSPQGGWPKSTDLATPPRSPPDVPPPGRGRANSIDNEATTVPMEFLMSLDDPTPEVIHAVKRGVVWFQSARIDGFRYKRSSIERNLTEDPSARPLWARFYEIQSNRPFFCDRDGVPKYDIEEIGSERRSGYTWYGNWGDSLIRAYAKWPHR